MPVSEPGLKGLTEILRTDVGMTGEVPSVAVF